MVRQQIRATALRCRRNPDTIRLVAVSKHQPVESIKEAIAAGQLLFGENYLQEAAEKIACLDKKASFHCIGHLQSNKAKTAASLFDCIETVDRFSIAQAIDQKAHALGKLQDVLIQVNIGRETQKSGILAENVPELLRNMAALSHVRIRGLMTIPPFSGNPESSRPYFRELRQLAQAMSHNHLFTDNREPEISMGMSDDFQIAIEEGATLVRVGTAIFGKRNL